MILLNEITKRTNSLQFNYSLYIFIVGYRSILFSLFISSRFCNTLLGIINLTNIKKNNRNLGTCLKIINKNFLIRNIFLINF